MTLDPHDHQCEPEPPDDFWGTQNEWPATSGIQRSARRTLGSAIGKWWDTALGSGAKTERSHGVSRRPTAARDASSGVGDLDDQRSGPPLDNQADDPRLDDLDTAWDNETAPAPVRRTGVDPLLARFGAIAVIVTLAVPVIMGATSGSSDDQVRTAAKPTVPSTSPSIPPATVSSPAPQGTVTADAAGQASSETSAAPVTDSNAGSDLPARATEPPAPAPATAPVPDAAVPEAAPVAELADEVTEPATTVASCGSKYELAAGDYWIRIADAAGVSLADLLDVNDATSSTMLTPGRSICLPIGASTPAPPTAPTPAPASTTPTSSTPTSSTTPPPSTPPPSTTPVTTATPATTTPPAPPPSSVTAEQVEAIIRSVWPDELEEHAIAIARRESNLQPNVRNYCCYGLFQIYWSVHRRWLEPLGITSAADLYDPTTNARAAYALYERSGGFGPWGG